MASSPHIPRQQNASFDAIAARKTRSVEFLRRLGKDSAADALESESVDDYARRKGILLENPCSATRQRNTGEGGLFFFHGAFQEKKAAENKAATIPHSFVRTAWFRGGPRYAVLTDKTARNPHNYPVARWKKPASQLTYGGRMSRSHHPSVRPKGPKRCAVCGSRKNIELGHKNGDNTDIRRGNHQWLCRRHNALQAIRDIKAGRGRSSGKTNSQARHGETVAISKSGTVKRVPNPIFSEGRLLLARGLAKKQRQDAKAVARKAVSGARAKAARLLAAARKRVTPEPGPAKSAGARPANYQAEVSDVASALRNLGYNAKAAHDAALRAAGQATTFDGMFRAAIGQLAPRSVNPAGSIVQVGPRAWMVDNGRGTQLVLVRQPHGWEVQSQNASAQAWRGRFGGTRTYNTLAQVEHSYKAFRGIGALLKDEPGMSNPRKTRNSGRKVIKKPAQFIITKRFIGGPLKGLVISESTTAKFVPGRRVAKPIGGSPYIVTDVRQINPRYAGDPRWLEARYPGTCAKCGAPIKKGDRAFYYPQSRTLLCSGDNCGEAASRDFEAHAFDDDFAANPSARNVRPGSTTAVFGRFAVERTPDAGVIVHDLLGGVYYPAPNEQIARSMARLADKKDQEAGQPVSPGWQVQRFSENPKRRRNANDLFGSRYAPTGTVIDAIRPGARVTIVDRFGKKRTGRATLRGPAHWVLNMGGAHGTPAIADVDNIVKVSLPKQKNARRRNANEVAQTILAQLGGRQFAAMTGAKDFVAGATSLMFRLPARFAKQGINKVRITLTPADTYTVDFFKITGTKVQAIGSASDVYADNLRHIFSDATGLDVSLGTMRGTNPARRRNSLGEAVLSGVASGLGWHVSDRMIKQVSRKRGTKKAARTRKRNADQRLFIGAYPGGIVYADRHREQHGDYKKLAFLPYDTLKLQMKPGVPEELRQQIETHAATLQARRGEQYPISSSGQTVLLGTKNPRRRNQDSQAQAAQLYQQFHGTPSTHITEILQAEGVSPAIAKQIAKLVPPEDRTKLGDLTKLCTKQHEITFGRGEQPVLASNPEGTQLFVIGGDQDVTPMLRDLGRGTGKTLVDLGECKQVEYLTRKGFDNFHPVTYYHELGEDTNERPRLMFDVEHKQLYLVGGAYKVRPEGIVN